MKNPKTEEVISKDVRLYSCYILQIGKKYEKKREMYQQIK